MTALCSSRRSLRVLSALVLALGGFRGHTAQVPPPVYLRVEGLLEDVAVISEPYPRFSFVHGDAVATTDFGVTQASYHIVVVDAGTSTVLWDSGEVVSTNNSQILYAGKPLLPFTRFAWTATWTSSAGVKSAASSARFETGPMQATDWQGAGWLSATTKSQFRNEFHIAAGKQIVYARAYVAALACAHVEVNGQVPLPDLRGICPWPVNSASARYMTHDVTKLLAPGRNALGIIAGNETNKRWTHQPQVIVLVVVRFAGENTPTFVLSSSSPGWMARPPYVKVSTAWDATIDWTKYEKGWSTPGFTPGFEWSVATAGSTTSPGYGISARALAMPLSMELGKVKPVAVRKIADGSFLYTFPKNFVGTIEFAPLPAASNGSALTVSLGEWLMDEPRRPSPPPPSPSPSPPTSMPVRCGLVAEHNVLNLGCPHNKIIDKILFASWGTPVLADVEAGCAAGFKQGLCARTGRIGNGALSLPLVERACLNQTECALLADKAHFDDPTKPDPCPRTVKALAAEIHCSGDSPGPSCRLSCYNQTVPPSPPQSPPPSPLAVKTAEAQPASYPMISGSTQQYENHVLRSGNTSPLRTLFCWHGFQYVLVTPTGETGFTGTLNALVALEIHTNVTATGSLRFGGEGNLAAENAAEVLRHINQMTLQSQQTNVGAYMVCMPILVPLPPPPPAWLTVLVDWTHVA